MSQPEVLYANISGDNEPCVMESLCVNCEQNGKTTILLTKIPMFSDIIIVAFECENCGYKNSEVQFGGKIKDQGVRYELKVLNFKDLSRQIVRSEQCKILIPDIDFEMPSNKKGTISTLEGFLQNIIEDLNQDQPVRKYTSPQVYDKIEATIAKLTAFKDGNSFPFTWVLYDPSGNSFIQNPDHPLADKNVRLELFQRTKEEIEEMGYSVENEKDEIKLVKEQKEEQDLLELKKQKENNQQKEEVPKIQQQQQQQSKEIFKDGVYNSHEQLQAQGQNFNQGIIDDVKQESLVFPTVCNVCGATGENKMCTVSIPHFKNILIMSFKCDICGNKDTEVKSQGEISAQGRLFKIDITNVKDLNREVFFSETASLNIPEIELELSTGTLGGVYSNVEGLLDQILTHLRDNNPFVGDSTTKQFNDKMNYIFNKLEQFKTGDVKFTMIIRDLVQNSFVQNIHYPDEDKDVTITDFERTAEDNDDLGIDTMKTENYEQN